MKTFLFIVIAGILVYLLLMFCLYLSRPFFLSRTFREIEQMYNRLLTEAEKCVSSAVENLGKWQSGDNVIRAIWTEDKIKESIDAVKAAKAHEEEVYEKFLKLRERYALNPKKLSESIVAYRRYLEVRFQHYEDAMLCESAVTSGAFSIDELIAARKEAMIALEKNERKLDILLTE